LVSVSSLPKKNFKIAVIIPAFNEEGAIGRVIQEIPPIVDKIIVVDNGSTDRTAEQARKMGAQVVLEKKKGYGYACLKGMEEASGAAAIVFLDGDYSDFPQEMERLIAPIIRDEADLVIGSRLRGRREKGAMLLHAFLANILFSLVLRFLWGLKVTDIGPFRAIRTKHLLSMGMAEGTYGWTLEMMIKAAARGLRVVEVPVSYRRRIGQSKVSGSLRESLKAGIKMILTIIQYSRKIYYAESNNH
jgi:glycosyltransferase involved in cell wall biosynthesis